MEAYEEEKRSKDVEDEKEVRVKAIKLFLIAFTPRAYIVKLFTVII